MANRIVVDRDNNVLFAYSFDASRGPSPGTVAINIAGPSAPVMEASMARKGRPAESVKFSGAHMPHRLRRARISGGEDRRSGDAGCTVQPFHGRQDFRRASADHRSACAEGCSRASCRDRAAHAFESMSLKNIAVRIDGQAVSAPASWMISSAVRIDIPGHGAYVIAAYDPKGSSPSAAFAAVAHADGKTLSWAIDGQYVEVTSQATNVLTQAVNSVLWVYHDAHYRSQDQPDAVRLQSADTVDWLLPKR